MGFYERLKDFGYEFGAETSLVGYKQLLPSFGPWFRRVIWLIIIIVFSCICLYQIGQIVWEYATASYSIDVKKNYPEIMAFPVVTICNSLQYRVSKVRPLSSMHIALSEIYATSVANSTALTKHQKTLEAIQNAREYLLSVAPRKEDMIVDCSYDNTFCSANDFEQIVTPNGVCISFNYDSNQAKMRNVTKPGDSYGLQLLLNIGRYDEMNGPYTIYGVKAIFGSQGQPDLAQGGINTYMGSQTMIALSNRIINFYEGYTCDSKSLKYFPTYTREACGLELAINKTMKECQCFPHILDFKLFANETTLKPCNLFQTLQCANPILTTNQLTGEATQKCPQECTVYNYIPVVSQAQVAWSRMPSSIQQARKNQNLLKNVYDAREISKRYRPEETKVTEELFGQMRNSTQAVKNLMEEVNKIQCELPIPSTTSTMEPMGDKLKGFRTSTWSKSIPMIRDALNTINKTTGGIVQLLNDDTLLPLFLGTASPQYFCRTPINNDLVSKYTGAARLETLDIYTKSLENLDKSRGELGAEFFKSFTTTNGAVLTLQNETDALNISFHKLLSIGIGAFGKEGCFAVPFHFKKQESENIVIDNVNITEQLTITDYFLCLQNYFSTENVKQSLAERLGQYINIIPTHVIDYLQQSHICTRILCEHLQGVTEYNCTLTAEDIKVAVKELSQLTSQMLTNCSDLFNEGTDEIEAFLKSYETNTLPHYDTAAKAASEIQKSVQQMTETFTGQIWSNETALDLLLDNMTTYEANEMDYKNFSLFMTEFYGGWLDQFGFKYNDVVKKLTQRRDAFANALKNIDTLLEMKSFHDSLTNNTDSLNGIYNVLANALLWKNSTLDMFDLIKKCNETSMNETIDEIARIPIISSEFQGFMEKIVDDTKTYLGTLKVNQDFFNRNFLALNVHYPEISQEEITQGPAYTFWDLLSNIGGTTGLYFGWCIASLIEFLDVAIRHIIWGIRRKATGKGKEAAITRRLEEKMLKHGLTAEQIERLEQRLEGEEKKKKKALMNEKMNGDQNYTTDLNSDSKRVGNRIPYNVDSSQD